MHHTRKNRSLKKKPNGLKKKSNKSSRKSKKSRRVNKRKIRGGLWSSTVSVDKFNEKTAYIRDIQNNYINKLEKDYGSESNPAPIYMLRMRMVDFIKEYHHIEACTGYMSNNKDQVDQCKNAKNSSYQQRHELGKQLLDDYDEIKKDYEDKNNLRIFIGMMASRHGGPGPEGREKVERLTDEWGKKAGEKAGETAEEKAGETAEPPLN